MARFSFEESDNYGGGKNSFFSLKDDKDTAVIRFLYNDMNDIQGVSCHSVKDGDKTIDVECLRAYNEPVSKCPFCEAGYSYSGKLFIPVYDETAKESKIWTRGKTFFSKLSSLCARYNPLVSTPFEIERNGKKGDTNTTYETYPMKSDDARIEDFPEINAEGVAFQVKSYDEMVAYLKTGAFEAPQENRRNVERDRQPAARPQPGPAREMPATPVRRRPNYDNEENF